MRGNDPLKLVRAALKELGGYFVFSDMEDEYVVLLKKDFDALRSEVDAGVQLTLPTTAEKLAVDDNDVLDQINRDIALFQSQQVEREPQTLDSIEEEGSGQERTRVRFEPLRGDLPPELQD